MPGRTRRLIIMAKEPQVGRVKSRLACDIGAVRAAMFQRTVLHTLLRTMLPDPRWHTLTAVAPDVAVKTPMLPDGERIAQGGGSLGDRMAWLFAAFPRDTVLITGSDIPAMTRDHVMDAFMLAERRGAVVGPSSDGGFWCIGLRGGLRPPDIFRGVRWSTEHALDDTLATLPGIDVARTAILDDVDDAAGYAAWRKDN